MPLAHARRFLARVVRLSNGIRRRLIKGAVLLIFGVAWSVAPVGAAQTKTKNAFLITADGLRWQEVFRGAEEMPLTKEFGNFGNSNTIRTNFWRETPEARREALL